MARTREAHFGPHGTYVGIDVGKSFHWACAVGADGAEVLSRRLENRPGDVDAVLDEVGAGALVVVDQKNNIGSLVVRRCRARGVDVGYMTGLTMKKARDMWPGTAKTDRIDAEVIARTAMGMRQVVLPIAESDDLGASLSLMSSQLEYATRCATQARNRLHAVLLESDPAFEAAELSAEQGFHPAAEDGLVRGLASQIADLDAQRREPESSIAAELAGDETYPCLLTVPGVGPKTATALATMVDVSLFAGDDRLASYCGPAPADRRSGTSVSSASASRSGNRTLKNLLTFSCSSLVGTKSRFGRYYDECRSRGMAHNRALKAVARKRLGVIFAIMRDKVPYEEPVPDCSKDGARAEGASRECSKSSS